MRVEFDTERCQGHAQCAANGPDVYILDDEGYCAIPSVLDVPGGLEGQASTGAAACPEQALTVIE
jgi:ferredoxin